jgi:hypothetical protein
MLILGTIGFGFGLSSAVTVMLISFMLGVMELNLGICDGAQLVILLATRLLFGLLTRKLFGVSLPSAPLGDLIAMLLCVSLASTIESSVFIPPKMATLFPDLPLVRPPTPDVLRTYALIFGDKPSLFFILATPFCSAKIPFDLNFFGDADPMESPIEA